MVLLAAGRARSARLDAITKDLRRRIRPVCLTMPDDIFLDLIEAMGKLQLKYELQSVSGAFNGLG